MFASSHIENSHIETLILNMMAVEDGAFDRYLGLEDGALIMGLCLLKEETLKRCFFFTSDIRQHSQTTAICVPGRGSSTESDQVNVQIQNFQPPQL